MDITANPILFGHDPTEGIVAVETGRGAEVVLIRREGEERKTETLPFEPVMLLADEALAQGYEGDVTLSPLSGAGYYKVKATLGGWDVAREFERHLKKTIIKDDWPDQPWLFPSDPVNNYLIATGKTLFKGMRYADLRRLQLDIEVWCAPEYEFPNAERESDRIIVVSMTDNRGWSQVISAKERDGSEITEKDVLKKTMAAIAKRDPDVIEGHNLFNFDLPYIEARCKRHKVKFAIGRDGKKTRGRASRVQIAERTLSYTKYVAWGRHIVDTLHLAQHYDVGTRDLESYSLKDVARHLGVTPEGRTYIEGHEISRVYESDVGRVLDYALDDVIETGAIAEVLGPSYFVQSQIFPYSYQNVIVRGNATRIDSLFVREYIHQGRAVPQAPAGGRHFAGGYTDVFTQGIIKRVLHCDVASLYPSIMLAFGMTPKADELKVFEQMLGDLRAFRLHAKRAMASATDARERQHFHALQSTFKILINSFYGYLGAGRAHFADPEVAAQVTEKGRSLLKHMVKWLGDAGCTVIEADTDGIYFSVPDTLKEEDEGDLVQRLSETLPEGIDLELDGRYPAMFSYKSKNYVLLEESGALVIKGSGLRSRSVERFQRDFMAALFQRMLKGRGDEIADLYLKTVQRITVHQWDVRQFSRRETLKDSLNTYLDKKENKKRPSSAAYELALASERSYQPGDAIVYYVTGEKKKVKVYEAAKMAGEWDPDNPDENTAYYLEKLKSLYKKFEPFAVDAGGPKLADMTTQLSLFGGK